MDTKAGQAIKLGMVVLGLTQAEDQSSFYCSLVFYVAEKNINLSENAIFLCETSF